MARIDVVPRNRVAITAFVICVCAGVALTVWLKNPWPAIAGLLIGLYCLFALQVVQPWERVALLRMGRYAGLRGPGFFHIVPIFETITPIVDQRVRVHSVTAESTLTVSYTHLDVYKRQR